jgi:hypothetical protein
LVEHWTLLPRETELLTNKTGATRLGFAVLLKFFQLEAYFPQQASAVPTVAVEFIAKQVKVAPEQFERYQWRGRTIEYHRAQIRKLHGFRETTVEDAQALSQKAARKKKFRSITNWRNTSMSISKPLSSHKSLQAPFSDLPVAGHASSGPTDSHAKMLGRC